MVRLLPECPFHALTGLYCPGCGVTRMVWLAVHGHPLMAMRENVLVAGLVPMVVVGVFAWARGWRPSRQVETRLSVGLSVVVLVFTVLRNVPVGPFRLLAPMALR